MKKTPAVTVWIVNIGKVINTRRKVLEVLLYRNYSAQWYLISSLTELLKLLPLVTLDSKESSIKIVYPEYNTMKKTSVVTVCCVNTGKVINTRRKVLEAVSKPTADMFRSTPDVADICVLKQTQG